MNGSRLASGSGLWRLTLFFSLVANQPPLQAWSRPILQIAQPLQVGLHAEVQANRHLLLISGIWPVHSRTIRCLLRRKPVSPSLLDQTSFGMTRDWTWTIFSGFIRLAGKSRSEPQLSVRYIFSSWGLTKGSALPRLLALIEIRELVCQLANNNKQTNKQFVYPTSAWMAMNLRHLGERILGVSGFTYVRYEERTLSFTLSRETGIPEIAARTPLKCS